jgi:hypothetical protein
VKFLASNNQTQKSNTKNMKFNVGDKVKRKATQMDVWWKDLCRDYITTPDAILTVVEHRDNDGLFLKEMAKGYEYTGKYFELVETSLEAQIKKAYDLAQSLIGKTVKFDTDERNFTVKSVLLRRNYDDYGLDYSSTKHLNQHGWVVAVKISNHLASINVPVGMVKEVPSETEVVLNSSHTAIVTKDTITVGCQTFPVDILKKLQTAVDNLA